MILLKSKSFHGFIDSLKLIRNLFKGQFFGYGPKVVKFF